MAIVSEFCNQPEGRFIWRPPGWIHWDSPTITNTDQPLENGWTGSDVITNLRSYDVPRTSTKNTSTETIEPPTLPEVPVLEGDELRRLQAWVEDRAVRAVRSRGYCSEVNGVLGQVFPNGPLDGSEYRDSDGTDCWGNTWRDADGYDRAGRDDEGFDREGFSAQGLDKDGFDKDGLDPNGVAKDDPARFKFDRWGYDKDGFNRSGVDRSGKGRDVPDSERFMWDDAGFSKDGVNRDGYNRRGEYVGRPSRLGRI